MQDTRPSTSFIKATVGVFLIAVTTATMASNLRFLRETPFTFYDEKDRKLFQTAVQETLNTAADHEVRHWSNSDTGSKGDLTVQRSLRDADQNCRELHIVNYARSSAPANSTALFCKDDGSGKWNIRASK